MAPPHFVALDPIFNYNYHDNCLFSPCTGIAWWGLKQVLMSDQEILKQRDLLDAILASRTTSQYDRLENMKVMDSIYFKENLPENVVLFPLQRIKRYVHTTTRKPSKKSL